MNAASSSQNSGMPSRAAEPRARRVQPGRAERPGARGGPRERSSPRGQYLNHRTMLPSNQVLIVGSCGPQVYGLIVCVVAPVSDGSAGSGFTPWSTG